MTSKRSTVNGIHQWTQTKNVTIKHCSDVYGTVRLKSTYYRPSDSLTFAEYKNLTGPIYVKKIRETSPTQIVLDDLNIRTDIKHNENTVYFEQGVTDSTLINSKIAHHADGLSLYISAEAAFNRIENNEFHHHSTNETWGVNHGRELMALDGTEGNIIKGNWFSGLWNDGIHLYRNCGEKGNIRYAAPQKNIIEDNIFYYHHADDPEPAVVIASRNGEDPGFWGDYCPDDAGQRWTIDDVPAAFGWDADWERSSTQDSDFARHNIVRNNRWCNRDVFVQIKNPEFNHDNEVAGNSTITCENSAPIPR